MEDWESIDGDDAFVFPPRSKPKKKSPSVSNTLVLVGRTGNGKSATGNSILGSRRFRSQLSAKSITSTCEAQAQVLSDGRTVRVIDTPGLLDVSDPEVIGNELAKCIDLANGGIHGILVVLSVRNRFTPEEIAAVQSLQSIFGPKVLNYMIVLFTGGDELEDGSLDEYLGESPEFLKEFIVSCGGRKVLFDNKTKDKRKLDKQLHDLLKVLDATVAFNCGVPYTSENFEEAKIVASREEETRNALEERFSKIELEMRQKADESELLKLAKELAETRERAEGEHKRFEEAIKRAEAAEAAIREQQQRAKEAIEAERKKLKEDFRRSKEELAHDFQQRYNSSRSNCSIL